MDLKYIKKVMEGVFNIFIVFIVEVYFLFGELVLNVLFLFIDRFWYEADLFILIFFKLIIFLLVIVSIVRIILILNDGLYFDEENL